ncbi:hypothetical protein A6X21_00075 [Planctopirus hydrillae]|uniref:Uncharacterized protein n=1 Tax=Planctopirus hydrillae TaxID=1841610 RepID=A0A1C3EAP4_9PLAN|nr:hypothetical protein A6X21_00075 [Planctopirus hydrillae]
MQKIKVDPPPQMTALSANCSQLYLRQLRSDDDLREPLCALRVKSEAYFPDWKRRKPFVVSVMWPRLG